MTNTKELRVGNFFETQVQDLIKVDAISPENVIFAVVDRDRCPLTYKWQAQPIPITEEWLKRLGFIFHDFYQTWQIQRNNLEDWQDKDDILYNCVFFDNHELSERKGKWCYQNGESNASCEFVKTIEFIHQLQNLHFALTDRELEIKA